MLEMTEKTELRASSQGGTRGVVAERYDLIPHEAEKAMARSFGAGEKKYGRLKTNPLTANWAGLDIASDQSPLSHAKKHLGLYQSGSTTDPDDPSQPEDHLANAMANIAMLIWFRDNPESPLRGKTYPEILAAVEQGPKTPRPDHH